MGKREREGVGEREWEGGREEGREGGDQLVKYKCPIKVQTECGRGHCLTRKRKVKMLPYGKLSIDYKTASLNRVTDEPLK